MTLRIAPLALGGLLALAGVNVWLLAIVTADHAPEHETAVTAAWTPHPLPSDAKLHAAKPIGAYMETLARPVFFKSRQPYVPPPPAPPPSPKPAAAPPPAPTDPGLVLGGVMIADGTRKAHVFNKADQRGAWLSEGDSIGGWQVEAVDSLSARLHQAGRTIELQLYPKR